MKLVMRTITRTALIKERPTLKYIYIYATTLNKLFVQHFFMLDILRTKFNWMKF